MEFDVEHFLKSGFFILCVFLFLLTIIHLITKTTALEQAVGLEDAKVELMKKAKHHGERALVLHSEGRELAAIQSEDYRDRCLARAHDCDDVIGKLLNKNPNLKDRLETYKNQNNQG